MKSSVINAHGHPEEECHQEKLPSLLTGARCAGRESSRPCPVMRRKAAFIAALLLPVLLLLAVAVVTAFGQNGTGGTLRVTVGRETYGEYRMDEDQTIVIEQPSGYNRIVIKDNAAYMEAADCPGRCCMDYKPVSRGNEMIICLPHRVIVEVAGRPGTGQPEAAAW